MDEMERIFVSIIVIYIINYYVNKYKLKLRLRGCKKSIKKSENLDDIESVLSQEVEQQMNDFVEDELQNGHMNEQVTNILKYNLETDLNLSPYDPIDQLNSFVDSGNDFQIKSNELPKYFKSKKVDLKFPKEKEMNKENNQNYNIDGITYSNPCMNDNFGFVMADDNCVKNLSPF